MDGRGICRHQRVEFGEIRVATPASRLSPILLNISLFGAQSNWQIFEEARKIIECRQPPQLCQRAGVAPAGPAVRGGRRCRRNRPHQLRRLGYKSGTAWSWITQLGAAGINAANQMVLRTPTAALWRC